MKNKQVETLRLAAKRHLRNQNAGHFVNGVRSYHCYDHRSETDLSWWDDCAFILNDYLVHLSWVHPRMVFQDRMKDEARRRVAHLDLDDGDIDGATPIYKSVGKSRKKVAFREWKPTVNDTWRESFEKALAELHQIDDFNIEPYLKVKWTSRSRFVELCVPMEVRSEDDLATLANLAKRLLKREASLNDEFPGYVYRRFDWEQDMLVNEKSAHSGAIHLIAGSY
ncbi:hypothetical protein [Undibacterium sp. Tian12W]|uniref:hypothetical protein n=1 Tax=Undibacterium sp. Tian12W TaxID=3413054 RepID=UPI003BF2489B